MEHNTEVRASTQLDEAVFAGKAMSNHRTKKAHYCSSLVFCITQVILGGIIFNEGLSVRVQPEQTALREVGNASHAGSLYINTFTPKS